MVLVRACRTREEMPAFLASMRARAASSDARATAAHLASAVRRDAATSSAAASPKSSTLGSPAILRRKRECDTSSKPSRTAAAHHLLSPGNLLQSPLRTATARKRPRAQSAGPTSALQHASSSQALASQPSNGKAIELVLRGLNIQYPFSRLILAGHKDIEVRNYPLGHRNIAKPEEEMSLIETPPKNQGSAAVDIALGSPPHRAQVIGTVRFSKSKPYKTQVAWDRDRPRHRIKRGSALDWRKGQGNKHAWRVRQVRRFREPVPVRDHTQTGYPTPRPMRVSLAQD